MNITILNDINKYEDIEYLLEREHTIHDFEVLMYILNEYNSLDIDTIIYKINVGKGKEYDKINYDKLITALNYLTKLQIITYTL